MILDPVTLPKNATIGDAQNTMREYSIGGIPIIDDQKKLIGIVTNRDLRFEKDYNKSLSKVMTSENLDFRRSLLLIMIYCNLFQIVNLYW